jgi:hypothetical protein
MELKVTTKVRSSATSFGIGEKQMFKKIATVAAILAFTASPVLAAQQKGLVNVSVDGNNVQVPIGVAAEVCGVSVDLIQAAAEENRTACKIDQQTAAEHNIKGQHGGNQQAQENEEEAEGG